VRKAPRKFGAFLFLFWGAHSLPACVRAVRVLVSAVRRNILFGQGSIGLHLFLPRRAKFSEGRGKTNIYQ
jgi:hypothetical protein